MSNTLYDSWGTNGPRNTDLRRLMLMGQTGAQIIYLVCVGAGDAFINRYWPTLLRYVNLGKLRLLVADEKPLKELIEERVKQARASGEKQAAEALSKQYSELSAYVNGPRPVMFVNIKDPQERRWYDHIRADIVLVLVPDHAHIEIAQQWLHRSTLILVEKPYNRELDKAEHFEHRLKTMAQQSGGDYPTTWVCPFDHYLAKIAEYVFNKEKAFLPDRMGGLIDRIGGLNRIEFAILEAGPVEEWRMRSLQAGMIYDLFSHVLAMLYVEVDLSTFGPHNVKRIAVARHKRAISAGGRKKLRSQKFTADTFACFDFVLSDYQGHPVSVRGAVGKGVGQQDEKFFTLIGRTGWIRCDLNPKGTRHILIKEEGDDEIEGPILGIKGGHTEFVETLLAGKYIEEPIGRLTGDAALQILHIMNNIRNRIPTSAMYEYEIGTNNEVIANNATPLRF